MYSAKRHLEMGNALTTIAAVWLSATIAGILPSFFRWNSMAQAGSLLLYAAFLIGYARWTRAGRRSAGAYFLAGFLLPFACFPLLFMLPMSDPHSFLAHCVELTFAGLNIGFQAHGGPDTPLEYYLPLMWVNLLLPIVAVVGMRSFIRYHRRD